MVPAIGAESSTELISVSITGESGNDWAGDSDISSDGRYVAFRSSASDLVSGDSPSSDIFVRDRLTGSTTREAQDVWDAPVISGDGRFLVFTSPDDTLVPGETNQRYDYDIFLKDLVTQQLSRVSVSSLGEEANGDSGYAAISEDGRFVAFESTASNLVPGDTNTCDENATPGSCPDIFLHDMQTGETSLVSVSSQGEQSNGASYFPCVSQDGRYVAFQFYGDNLVPNDTNADSDVLVRDRSTGITLLASVSSLGVQGNAFSWGPALSSDGRYVTFMSGATNLVPNDGNATQDIFVRDLVTSESKRISLSDFGAEADGSNISPQISSNGRYIAFWSEASNLVGDDSNGAPDAFVFDQTRAQLGRVSVSPEGAQGNGGSFTPSVANDGTAVFDSRASNFSPVDHNQTSDVFVHTPASDSPLAPQIFSPSDGQTFPSSWVVVSGGSKPATLIQVFENQQLLGQTATNPDQTWNVQLSLADGQHEIYAIAVDAQGHTSLPSAPRGFSIDLTPPDAPTITSPEEGSLIPSTPVAVTGTATPADSIEVWENGVVLAQTSTGNDSSWTVDLSLSDGSHALQAFAVDSFGRRSPASAIRSFTIDTTPPARPTIEAPADGSPVIGNVVASGTAEPFASVEVWENGAVLAQTIADASGAWSLSVSYELGIASHRVTVTARDAAGHTSDASSPRDFFNVSLGSVV
ncbi:MAG: Ig-like domain-containing protein [Actinomycetota bacterium]